MDKKIVLVSHCILNNGDNAKELVKYFAEQGVGIVQMPCPKMTTGTNLSTKKNCPKSYRNYCKGLSAKIISEIAHYSKTNHVLGVIGIENSANCGVYKFSSGKKGWGKGILFEELEKRMEEQRVQIPFFGFNQNNAVSTVQKFQTLIQNS